MQPLQLHSSARKAPNNNSQCGCVVLGMEYGVRAIMAIVTPYTRPGVRQSIFLPSSSWTNTSQQQSALHPYLRRRANNSRLSSLVPLFSVIFSLAGSGDSPTRNVPKDAVDTSIPSAPGTFLWLCQKPAPSSPPRPSNHTSGVGMACSRSNTALSALEQIIGLTWEDSSLAATTTRLLTIQYTG